MKMRSAYGTGAAIVDRDSVRVVWVDPGKYKLYYDRGFTFLCNNERDKNNTYFAYNKDNISWTVVQWYDWLLDLNEFSKLERLFYL